MSHHAPEFLSRLNQALGFGIALVKFAELLDLLETLDEPAFFHALCRIEWNQFSDLVAKSVRHAEGSAGVPNCGARRHGSESNDLGDAVVAVFLLDISNYLVASSVGKIEINIRHRDALGI